MSELIIINNTSIRTGIYDDVGIVLTRTLKATLFVVFDSIEFDHVNKRSFRGAGTYQIWLPNRCITVKEIGKDIEGLTVYGINIYQNDWFKVHYQSVILRKFENRIKKVLNKFTFLNKFAEVFGINIGLVYKDTSEPFPNCMACNKINDQQHFIVCTSCTKVFENDFGQSIIVPTIDEINTFRQQIPTETVKISKPKEINRQTLLKFI